MPWQVAVVLDEVFDASLLLSQMPVWARSTPDRIESADKIRRDWNGLWGPEPSYTLINSPIGSNSPGAISAIVPTIEMHHPCLSCLRLVGLARDHKLTQVMLALGYAALADLIGPGIGFAKPLESLSGVPDLELDAGGWKSADDVYDAFFRAVHAPAWHGRNLDALNDSISTGNINEIEVPYRVVIRNASHAQDAARRMIPTLVDLIRRIEATGCPVSVVVHE
jgi:RNAse (barnase) inhibitor barstar